MTRVPLRTALLIPVSEAEPIVGRWRWLFDPSAQHGVPPHVTLIFPYLPSDRCDSKVSKELRSIFHRSAAFDFELDAVGEFPGVLYLSPRPGEAFICLIHALVERFPDAPPYGGAFPAIIPHLTIAHSCDAATQAAMTREVSASLPVHCRAREALLMRERSDGQWQISERFALGGAA